jgi:hypothetical protein
MQEKFWGEIAELGEIGGIGENSGNKKNIVENGKNWEI